MINEYTRESGLRNLERQVADVCRKLAMLCLRSGNQDEQVLIDAPLVTKLLGPRKFYREAAEAQPQRGVATGMVWAETGGEIINVEAALMPGTSALMLTGSLGEVLRESAQTALSFLRSQAGRFGVAEDFSRTPTCTFIFPLDRYPRMAPRQASIFASPIQCLLTRRPARQDVALTGEMTLTGRILPVSGIREKVLAAKRAGVYLVLLPSANREEIDALEADVIEGVRIQMVAHAEAACRRP